MMSLPPNMADNYSRGVRVGWWDVNKECDSMCDMIYNSFR